MSWSPDTGGHRASELAEQGYHAGDCPRPGRRCQATIIMVDSNLQRESLLPSERAFAYKMKLDGHEAARLRVSALNIPSQVGTEV